MLHFEELEVMNFRGAFRGMRNALDSWDKSDSVFNNDGTFTLGSADIDLAQRLISSGETSERKFLRQIFVCVDITAPLEWWIQFDTYKVGVVKNSCSTMHTLVRKTLTVENCELRNTTNNRAYVADINKSIAEYNAQTVKDASLFESIQKAVPKGYRLKATVTMNYENVRNMCHQRESHRISDWHSDFIKAMHKLPYANELIFYKLK